MGLFTKVTKCAFCGAPITTGLFGGNSWEIQLSETMHCCINCYNQINPYVERRKERLENKIENMRKSTRARLSGEDIANFVKQYMQEEKYYESRYGTVKSLEKTGFFRHNGYGLFSVAEAPLDSVYSWDTMTASNRRNMDLSDIWFSREDITCIEYCCTTKMGITMEDMPTYYSFDIRLNDQRYFTYRPSIVNICIQGDGLFNGRRKAEDQLLYMLEGFQRVIGSDLPIIKHDKFRR